MQSRVITETENHLLDRIGNFVTTCVLCVGVMAIVCGAAVISSILLHVSVLVTAPICITLGLALVVVVLLQLTGSMTESLRKLLLSTLLIVVICIGGYGLFRVYRWIEPSLVGFAESLFKNTKTESEPDVNRPQVKSKPKAKAKAKVSNQNTKKNKKKKMQKESPRRKGGVRR